MVSTVSLKLFIEIGWIIIIVIFMPEKIYDEHNSKFYRGKCDRD